EDPEKIGENRREYSDEPVKKKFGKTARKERKLKCSVSKTFGHNKKGCPTLKNVGTSTAGTSVATPRTNVTTSDLTNAAIGSQSSVNEGPSVATASTFCGSPTNASSSNVRVATASTSVEGLEMHQHLMRGLQQPHKRPREKKAKTEGYGLLFGSGCTVTERDVNSVTLSSSTPTNIDLGYKPNGLGWKGKAAITQRQL
ncbi:hypothetical protein MTR67_039235, partial [Solanum verrucosum]